MAPVVLDRPAAPPTPYRIDGRRLDARPTAVLRGTVPPDSVVRWLFRAHERVRAVLDAHGVPVAGPPFARFAAAARGVSVEAGFPVPAAIGDLGEVVASGLPGGTVVVGRHEDLYTSLDVTYAALDRWLRRHGYVAAGPHWEVYPVLGDGVTEVVVPYAS
jgi:hypothetical protein